MTPLKTDPQCPRRSQEREGQGRRPGQGQGQPQVKEVEKVKVAVAIPVSSKVQEVQEGQAGLEQWLLSS